MRRRRLRVTSAPRPEGYLLRHAVLNGNVRPAQSLPQDRSEAWFPIRRIERVGIERRTGSACDGIRLADDKWRARRVDDVVFGQNRQEMGGPAPRNDLAIAVIGRDSHRHAAAAQPFHGSAHVKPRSLPGANNYLEWPRWLTEDTCNRHGPNRRKTGSCRQEHQWFRLASQEGAAIGAAAGHPVAGADPISQGARNKAIWVSAHVECQHSLFNGVGA